MNFDLVDVHYEGQTLQMRPSQLTVANIARTFCLIPETIFLVSERGTVALPTDGVFDDVDRALPRQSKETKVQRIELEL